MKTIRIAAGQGFWGDWLEAPIRQVQLGQIDYLMLDYLAEVTMSILAKQKQKNPEYGYAHDFVELISRIKSELSTKKIKVIANAGGVNPLSCAKAVRKILDSESQTSKLKIAVVTGDNIFPEIDDLIARGVKLSHLENNEPISSIQNKLLSANAYLGAEGVVEALKQGADIVITGRVADPSLVLAPLIHEFGWSSSDWDLLASGTIAGHIIECGPQSSGGNFSYDWQSIEDFENIGFPIVEMSADGSFVVTKHENTGGKVSIQTVTEQLVYEIGDPQNYISPDVIADFTALKLEQIAENRVRVTGARGKPRTDKFKVSACYAHGFIAQGTIVYSWPDAIKKARRAGEIITNRIGELKLNLERIHTELIGVNACHGELSDVNFPEIAEVMLRVAVHGFSKPDVERFTREMAPLVLGGPPSATGYAGGKQDVKEVAAYWPALIDRSEITPQVQLL